jgi:ADP-ribosyl-[dinitrogen reductase] hydrolase
MKNETMNRPDPLFPEPPFSRSYWAVPGQILAGFYPGDRDPAVAMNELKLCSVESLVEQGFDTGDMAHRFLKWRDHGLWTATGDVFDIGVATSQTLMRVRRGVPPEEAGGTDDYSNGNGSLMRILPVVLLGLWEDTEQFLDSIHRASAITHGPLRSQMSCAFFGLLVRAILEGRDKDEALKMAGGEFAGIHEKSEEMRSFQSLMRQDFAKLPESEINSGGYAIDTLEAAIWCLLTTDDFAACVLKAVNLGGDTDTTACVAGGLAGVLYGEAAIPEVWRATLPRQGDLTGLFEGFLHVAGRTEPVVPDVQSAQPPQLNKPTQPIKPASRRTAIPEGSQPLAGD